MLPALLALGVCWLVLGWPWLSGRVTIPWDAKAQYLPPVQFLAQSFARGESPFWTPYVFSGYPQVADPQSLIFSPPYVILALLNSAPGSYALDLTLLISILVAAGALLIWCRDQGWHWAGALLAALSFAFGAAMAWRLQHTLHVLSLCYLVVALLFLARALNRRSIAYGLAAGVTAAIMVVGREQNALLGAYLLLGYVLWHIASEPEGLAHGARAAAPPLAAGAVAGILIVTLPVLITAFVTADSNRPAIDYIGAGRGSLHPALLLTAFAPDVFGSSGRMEDYWGPPSFAWSGTDLFIAQNVGQLYIGAIAVIALLIGAVTGALWQRDIRFVTVALILALLYALGWYTPVFRLFHALLPGADYYRRPADAVFLIGLLSAILAGYSLHRLLAMPPLAVTARHLATVAGIIAGAFALAILLALHFDRLEQAAQPLAVAAALLVGGALCLAAVLWLMPIRPRAATALLLAFTVADLAISNGPGSATALPPDVYDVLEPSTTNETIAVLKAQVAAGMSTVRRDRIELTGLGFHWANASLTHGLENTLGYNPVRSALYSAAVGAGDHIISPQDRKFTPLFPSYKSTLANLLGLRFIAIPVPIEEIDKKLQPGDLTLITKTDEAYIYENPRTLPRVLFATKVLPARFDDLLASGAWPSQDLSETVVLEQSAPAPESQPERRPGSARLTIYGHTEVEVEADSPDGGWVVLNDIWHPWWVAEIDRMPAPMLRANVLFRAVEVPPGRHAVRFRFRPVEGALTSLAERWHKLSAGGR